MFCEESLGKINWCEVCQAFPERVLPRIISLESVITLEQVNSSVVKKQENLNKQKAYWSGVANFRSMQNESLLRSDWFSYY